MKKFYPLAVVFLLFKYTSSAQKITNELINFTQLAKFEAAHPELRPKACKTCAEKEKERDGGWREMAADMPIPADALIKKEKPVAAGAKPNAPVNRPTTGSPLGLSPEPTRSFLGYVDPGTGMPPDTHGAVGPNHVVTATNDFTVIQAKNGNTISTVSINTFANLPVACDPYIKFDPISNRFIYSVIDCNSDASGQPINGNRMIVMVSATSDPTGNWFRYSLVPGTGYFTDHPYMGFDDRWIIVSGRKFPSAGFDGSLLIVLDKATLLSNGTLSFGVNAQKIEKGVSDGDTPLPVTVYGTNPSPGTFCILQNWSGANGLIRLSTVTGNIPNAKWNTGAPNAVFPASGIPWTSQTGNVAEQLEETRKLATNDARISTGVMVNGNIWCAQHIGITPTNVAVQWWQLNGTPGSSFGSVLQRGRIGDGLANNYRWFPAIAVNQSEDVLIGYSMSSKVSRVSAAYSFRSNATPPNTTEEEFIYKTGLSKYFKDFGGPRARWGDYSHSALDPTDGSLWTIQEYADQRIGNSDEDSRYGVWWAQVSPLSTLLQRDASVGAVIEPNNGLFCNEPAVPKITVRNLGTDTLRSVQVGLILDGIPLGSLNSITGLSVATFNTSVPIVLTPSFNAGEGEHTLQVFTINPNGSVDQRKGNDTSTVIFTIAPTLELPYTETFLSTTFPPANGTAIINPDAPGFTWTRYTINPGNADSSCIRLNCFNYGSDNSIGQRDIYRLPKINSSIVDSVNISFKVAYRQYFSSDVARPSQDSLRVVYSPDCGVSWIATDYVKGGTTLATVPGTTAESFRPLPTQWRYEKVTLKNLCEKNLKNVMIGFESVNDFGNNIYVDSIVVKGYNSYSNNAVLKSISQPLPALCADGFKPTVTFGNHGMDTIRSLKINYQLDGGSVNTLEWAGILTKCDSVTLDLAAGTSTTGTHILKVFTSEPNGKDDDANSNDTLVKAFSIYTAANTPLLEDFESAKFPNDNWGVQNVNGGVTWVRSMAASAASTGNGALLINNPNTANPNNAVDYFVSPIVINSNSFDSVFADFDLSYKAGQRYPGSTMFALDTLEILATKDCGANFVSVWKKWGEDLQTVNDPNYSNTTVFTPAQKAEWKSVRVHLTPYVGKSDNFQLYFVAKGNRQNNIWLDNIKIHAQTLPERLKTQGYLIYPNPFNSSFRIHYYASATPLDLQGLQLFNSSGQLVWSKQYNGNAERQINIDTKSLARGMYILKLMYANKTIVEKLIKN